MEVGEVIAQLAEQTVAKGSADVVCIVEGESDLYVVKSICWDEELEAHVIEMELHE